MRLSEYSLILLVLAASLLPLPLRGQTIWREVPQLEFAHLERNRIIMKGDSSSFETLYRKMDSVMLHGQGNLRVMHIGGSHVQAGTLTRQLRNDLISLSKAKDGGRGLVFPFSAARTNNPSSFRTRHEGSWTVAKNVQREPSKRLGLTGMALSTSDPGASVGIVLKPRAVTPDDPAFGFDRVDVLGYSAEGDREPLVVLESGDTLRGERHEEASCWSFDLPELLDSVKVAIGGTEGELTLTGIFLDNSSPGISVTGIGVNGAALGSYAKCEDLSRDLRMVNPDLVIFAVGINDAVAADFSEDEFIARYEALVDKVKEVNPACALLFISNNDSFRRVRRRVYNVNKNALLVEDAFMRIADECGGGVWDLFDIMGGLGSMKSWEAAGLAKRDKIHFTEAGYSLLGDLLYNALIGKYMEHLRRKL